MAEQISREISAEPVPTALGAPATLVSRGTLAVTIGNMLEFYDFITYSFFAIQIGHTFFPTDSQFASLMLSLATFGAGLLPGRSAGW
jgi:MHS family citrate/tricarballylate:H+ symporter-like MFS transporter